MPLPSHKSWPLYLILFFVFSLLSCFLTYSLVFFVFTSIIFIIFIFFIISNGTLYNQSSKKLVRTSKQITSFPKKQDFSCSFVFSLARHNILSTTSIDFSKFVIPNCWLVSKPLWIHWHIVCCCCNVLIGFGKNSFPV